MEKNIYNLKSAILAGFLRNIISITTLFMILNYFYQHEIFEHIIMIYPIWFIFNWFFTTYHEFEKKKLATPKLYKSGIPMVVAFILSLYIIGFSIYKYFF